MNRRSIRKFKDRPVEREKIEKIIEGALTTPSGRNLKPCSLVIVDQKDKLEKLAQSRGVYSNFIKNAPLAVVVTVDYDLSRTWISDASILAITIQYMAESLGLSSCWAHALNTTADDGSNMEENIRNILSIPSTEKILCVLALGYKDEEKPSHKKENLDYSKIHYNKF